ncbi:hypothetical protein [Streptomyces rhizosphaerihabitans]|uniref:hypothetical protein n=1 Tax=Streptomyces rhizosphaerihabitans TaxID=1266770 RepID=UPI0021BFD088|nr:hypothetical protein [Streptomyces rhizosphaerihabitans]MCT9009488.1 hypothetical protein [Streptomyces rhizosphaerihabitans]
MAHPVAQQTSAAGAGRSPAVVRKSASSIRPPLVPSSQLVQSLDSSPSQVSVSSLACCSTVLAVPVPQVQVAKSATAVLLQRPR